MSMKKFEGILICTDLDGTLLKEDKSISKENLDAIEYFKSEGGIFTFITGRMPKLAGKMYEAVKPNAPVGCINGSGIYDYAAKTYLWKNPLDKEAIELVEFLCKNVEELGFQLVGFEQVYICRENEEMKSYRALKQVDTPVCDYRSVTEPLGKILLVIGKEEDMLHTIELIHSHPKADKFSYIRSERTLYEILPKGVSKGELIKQIAKRVGIDISKTISIGDYNNDIEMLKEAGVGIAVANATKEAKAAADFITVSNEENAIAKVIYDLEDGKFGI